MNNRAKNAMLRESIGTLPQYVRTRNGALFDPHTDRWAFRDSTKTLSLDFSRLDVSPTLLRSFKASLVWYAENKSSHHLKNMYERFAHFLKAICVDGRKVAEISADDLLNYRASLQADQRWYVGNLSGFLQKWHSLNLPGVAADTIALLKQLRIKGNRKGEAILTMDPENGPYTDIEFESIYSALDDSYESGKVGLGDYLLVWLFMALGQRPIQYAGLKLCDVVVSAGKDGASVYTLKIPRAKQRGQPSRSDFKDRVLIPQIGERLVQHREDVRDAFRSILPDSDQAPLFPAKRSRKNEPQGFEYHRTAESLASTLKGVLNRLSVTSERTGRAIHITATRFRRTLGNP